MLKFKDCWYSIIAKGILYANCWIKIDIVIAFWLYTNLNWYRSDHMVVSCFKGKRIIISFIWLCPGWGKSIPWVFSHWLMMRLAKSLQMGWYPQDKLTNLGLINMRKDFSCMCLKVNLHLLIFKSEVDTRGHNYFFNSNVRIYRITGYFYCCEILWISGKNTRFQFLWVLFLHIRSGRKNSAHQKFSAVKKVCISTWLENWHKTLNHIKVLIFSYKIIMMIRVPYLKGV